MGLSSNGLPEDLSQLRVTGGAGVEAVAADVFGVRGNLASTLEQVDQCHVITCRLLSNTGIPALNAHEHLRFLSGGVAGKGGQARQIGQIRHENACARPAVQLGKQCCEVLHIVIIGHAADEIVSDQPDRNQIRGSAQCQW